MSVYDDNVVEYNHVCHYIFHDINPHTSMNPATSVITYSSILIHFHTSTNTATSVIPHHDAGPHLDAGSRKKPIVLSNVLWIPHLCAG